MYREHVLFWRFDLSLQAFTKSISVLFWGLKLFYPAFMLHFCLSVKPISHVGSLEALLHLDMALISELMTL